MSTPRTTHRVDHFALVVRSLLEILIIATFVCTFVAQPSRIPTASMEPTLRVGDMMLTNNQAFSNEGWFSHLLPPTRIRRSDVAIFHFPGSPGTDLVKRIVGLPGDRIRLRDGHVLLNGSPLTEHYAFYSPSTPDAFRDNFPSLYSVDPDVDPAWWTAMRRSIVDGEIRVPPGHYFVLGDNRNDSEDSRYWGFVPHSQLVGEPLLVYLPALAPEENYHGPLHRLRVLLGSFRVVR